ncbi:MAG: hypothetical protein CVV27_14340 [Candidatus Melainabacteria bacterium HGW-Melainabacteria-1]|nr:MAG: hypothetical protein CVV27_14340 [Candidatus Melainabacteria bacterium HGW-Melainabacteria-1]
MTKIFTILTAPVLITMLLTACGSPQTSVSPAASQPGVLQPLAPTRSNTVLADAGHGHKTPAQLSFQIKLDDMSGFGTKASSAGTAAKTLADLTDIKFYLVESDTGTPPTALAGSGFSHTITPTNITNGFVNVTFTNVAANATGKSYYVVAAGFSSATLTAANNITNLDAPINDGTEGKYFASTTGGSPAGAVRVTPTTYAISGTTALGVPLQLLDAVTPILESSVNITVGDEISGAPSGSAN